MTLDETWTWGDGWILMAVHLAGDSGGAQLFEIIGAADATNHVIPTPKELSRALTKLVRCNVIAMTRNTYAIVEDHLEAIKSAYQGRGGLFESAAKGLAWLMSARLSPLTDAVVDLSDAEVQSAYGLYLKVMWSKKK